MRIPALARLQTSFFAAILGLLLASPSSAQEPQAVQPPGHAEIELNLIDLSTTQSLRRHQSYFRVTHRFARDLRRGDFGELLEDLFSLDNGAVIGLEYRFGITGNSHAAVNRTALSKTIQFFGRYDGWRQSDSMPIAISVLGSVEGLNNFQQDYQPGIAAVLSRVATQWLVFYVSPTFVWNTKAADFLDDHDHDLPGAEEDEHAQHEHTMFVGLGARVRFRPTAYVVGEYSPRLAGHDPGRAVWAVGVEKVSRSGKHLFQLNFTNSFGTTFGQAARGGSEHDVYLGFNIARKF
jgi:hypothetical protein